MPGPSYAGMPGSEVITPPAEQPVVEMTTPIVPKHVGGGWYELSDGSRVQGKDDAVAEQAKL